MQNKILKIALVFGVVSILVMSGSFFAFSANSNGKENTSPQVSSSLPASMQGASFALIKLYNNQSLATPSPFQQEIVVNSSSYSTLENANLSNVEFAYMTGQVIPSWLESGNSYNSTASVYWLNLTGIAANSVLSIYIVFLPLDKIAFNGVNVGEAAQLSGAYGTSSYGIYNDISAVMSPGLMYQFYVPTTGTNYYPGSNEMNRANLTPLSYIPGALEQAQSPTYNTNASGTTQYVYYYGNTSNVIINLRAAGYLGGMLVPNPPVTQPSSPYYLKAIGWINVKSSGNSIYVEADDGIIAGTSTIGGLSSGYMWSNNTNLFNHFIRESSTFYANPLSAGSQRIQIGFGNQGGGPSMLAMWTQSSSVGYYHAILPPNGVMPGVSFSHSILKNLYGFTVSSTGLPPNLNWTLSIEKIGNLTLTGTSSYTFNLPNGTYNYTATSNNKTYRISSTGGSFTISGSSASLTEQFTEVTYTVTFTQTPTSLIQNNVTWFVNLSGAQSFNLSTLSNSTSVQLHNGTYRVSYSSVEPSLYQAENAVFIVEGSSLNLTVNFQKAFPVYLNETGLPAGTVWYANTTYFGPHSSTTSSIMLYSLNGTYSFTVNTVNKTWRAPGGSYTVNGNHTNKSVVFSQVLYEIFLLPSGYPIPSNITWYADATNGAFHANATGMNGSTVNLTNGTYSYSLHTSTGNISGMAGSFIVSGSVRTVYLDFYLVTFSVNFTETGLPFFVEWYVNTFNGSSFSSSTYGNFMSFNIQNGTFNYSVGSYNSSYMPEVRNGQITVAGSNVTVNVVFVPVKYAVNFTAKGLPAGTEWNLFNGSANFSTTGKLINLNLKNGTYTFSVSTTDTAYSPFLSVVVVRVDGASLTAYVVFYEKTSSVTFTVEGLPTSVSTWYLNITGGPSLIVQGQSVSLNLAFGNYSYTVAIAGSGTVSSGNISVGQTALNVYVNLTGTGSGSTINGTVSYSFGGTALYDNTGMTWLQEVTQ